MTDLGLYHNGVAGHGRAGALVGKTVPIALESQTQTKFEHDRKDNAKSYNHTKVTLLSNIKVLPPGIGLIQMVASWSVWRRLSIRIEFHAPGRMTWIPNFFQGANWKASVLVGGLEKDKTEETKPSCT